MQYAYKAPRFMLQRGIIMLCCQVMGSRVRMFGNYSSVDCMQNKVQISITYRILRESKVV
jgi:hypothetical protein